jgi:hypothetical protein
MRPTASSAIEERTMITKTRFLLILCAGFIAFIAIGTALAARTPPVDIKVELRCSAGDTAPTYELDLKWVLKARQPADFSIVVSLSDADVIVVEQAGAVGVIRSSSTAETAEGVHIIKIVRQKDGAVDAGGELGLTSAVEVTAEDCGTHAGTRLFVGNLSMNTE